MKKSDENPHDWQQTSSDESDALAVAIESLAHVNVDGSIPAEFAAEVAASRRDANDLQLAFEAWQPSAEAIDSLVEQTLASTTQITLKRAIFLATVVMSIVVASASLLVSDLGGVDVISDSLSTLSAMVWAAGSLALGIVGLDGLIAAGMVSLAGLTWLQYRRPAWAGVALAAAMTLGATQTNAQEAVFVTDDAAEQINPCMQPVSTDIAQPSIESTLSSWSKLSGAGLVLPDTITGEHQLKLERVPLKTAVAHLLEGSGYRATCDAGTLVVKAQTTAAAPPTNVGATNTRPSNATTSKPTQEKPRAGIESFGSDVVVKEGDFVAFITSMGGDITVDGRVAGDVETTGGDIEIAGTVGGDVTSLGGDVTLKGDVHGSVNTMGGNVLFRGGHVTGRVNAMNGKVAHNKDATASERAHVAAKSSAVTFNSLRRRGLSAMVWFGLLFVVGLLSLSAAPRRYHNFQAATVHNGWRMVARGALSSIWVPLLVLALFVSGVGAPAGVVLILVAPIMAFIGASSVASVVGAALPITALRDKPARQLAAGCVILGAISMIPVLGTLMFALLLLTGFGIVFETRFGRQRHRATQSSMAVA